MRTTQYAVEPNQHPEMSTPLYTVEPPIPTFWNEDTSVYSETSTFWNEDTSVTEPLYWLLFGY